MTPRRPGKGQRVFRSPSGIYAALLQAALGVLFGLMQFASGMSFGEHLVYGVLALALLTGAVRASFMRVVLVDHELFLHGYWASSSMVARSIRPEVVDDKMIAAVWAPVVTKVDGSEEALTLLARYGSASRPNGRVARICHQIMSGLDSPGKG